MVEGEWWWEEPGRKARNVGELGRCLEVKKQKGASNPVVCGQIEVIFLPEDLMRPGLPLAKHAPKMDVGRPRFQISINWRAEICGCNDLRRSLNGMNATSAHCCIPPPYTRVPTSMAHICVSTNRHTSTIAPAPSLTLVQRLPNRCHMHIMCAHDEPNQHAYGTSSSYFCIFIVIMISLLKNLIGSIGQSH